VCRRVDRESSRGGEGGGGGGVGGGGEQGHAENSQYGLPSRAHRSAESSGSWDCGMMLLSLNGALPREPLACSAGPVQLSTQPCCMRLSQCAD
jgi:hypothetical protein